MPKKMGKPRAKQARSKRRRTKTGAAPLTAPERLAAHSYETPPQAAPQPQQTVAMGYQFVTSELRRIGMTAGAMFLILIVLAFILR